MKATRITSHTLVGIGGGEYPLPSGNCFSVTGDDGQEYRIVNFGYENMQELQRRGLTWPVTCKVIGGRTAVINDARIGDRWYDNRYCEVCCPQDLLPPQQLLQHERAIERGDRKEHDGFTQIKLGSSAEFQ